MAAGSSRRRAAGERSAHVACAAGCVKGLAEVRGHLLVPARTRLGERDDPVRTRLRDEGRALEQGFDTFPGVGRRGLERDPHQPPLVEVAADQAGLLEHADEDTRVAFRHEGRQLVGLDEPRCVEDPIPGAAPSGPALGYREAAKRGRVARAREEKCLLGSPSRPRGHHCT